MNWRNFHVQLLHIILVRHLMVVPLSVYLRFLWDPWCLRKPRVRLLPGGECVGGTYLICLALHPDPINVRKPRMVGNFCCSVESKPVLRIECEQAGDEVFHAVPQWHSGPLVV